MVENPATWTDTHLVIDKVISKMVGPGASYGLIAEAICDELHISYSYGNPVNLEPIFIVAVVVKQQYEMVDNYTCGLSLTASVYNALKEARYIK